MPAPRNVILSLLLLSGLTGCERKPATLFTRLSGSETGIRFVNTLHEDAERNVLLYEYLYNGGGVATGDLNGDGWDDVFFTGNANPSKLYLNRKDFQFEDITQQAGVGGRAKGWRTGVSIVDINADGQLDLYVSCSGPFPREQRTHHLYINQGNDANGVPHFRDEAETYGLADEGFTIQTAFLDYDHDGDLDALLINHNPRRMDQVSEPAVAELFNTPDPLKGIVLYRNDNGHFTNVTAGSGLHNTIMSYSLGVGVSDVNGDGWPDLYISSDYLTPDYLYINNQNGGFTDQTGTALRHTAQFSMGNDIADVNNDALPDIMTLDMLPEDNRRQKMLFAPDRYEEFDKNIRLGFHPQFMRNMLQLNMGSKLGAGGVEQGAKGLGQGVKLAGKSSMPHAFCPMPTFAEVGQLAGVSATDWSWAPLLADFDNDGWKDLFVTNGFLRDFTNMDFLKYMDTYFREKAGSLRKEDLIGVVEKIPASNVRNAAFRNTGHGQFDKVGDAWGLSDPTNSNGAAYADLDNDGDLDLIVNNLNAEAGIYRNNGQPNRHYLRLHLNGNAPNRLGIGAKVEVYAQGQRQFYEQYLTRGYQSSISPVLHIGLGVCRYIDSVRITWSMGSWQVVRNIKADTTLTLNETAALSQQLSVPVAPRPIFTTVPNLIPFVHRQRAVNDFKRQSLLINGLSYSGPCLAQGDVNGDGLADVFVGGAAGQTAHLFVQRAGKQPSFIDSVQPEFGIDAFADDTDALFFDADRDGDLDLYVCSGGYHLFAPDDPILQDRLYLNNGRGKFAKSTDALPLMHTSSSCVRTADLNHDGLPDLFVGGRVVPGRYPEPPRSYVLLNRGKTASGQLHFEEQTQSVNAALPQLGMVTDAAWADLNGDQRPDLITVGDWLPIQIWINKGGNQLVDETATYLPGTYYGWWNKLLVTDLNGDGKPDILAGNQGLNGQIRASNQQPADLYYADFDNNETVDPILCAFIQGKSYPYLSRDELLSQLPSRATRFPDYQHYADATLTDVLSADELTGAKRLITNCLTTKLFLSNQSGRFTDTPLPIEVQYAPVLAMLAQDLTGDGYPDLVLGGNITHARLRLGQCDASYGILLQNNGHGRFRYVSQTKSGLTLTGDVRSLLAVPIAGQKPLLLIGRNGQAIQAFRW